jgi:hypothetical protein
MDHLILHHSGDQRRQKLDHEMLGTANCGPRERTLTAFLLPLLAGGGWEGGCF